MDKSVLEIGGRAIYEFRAHPKRAPWDKAASETRASYRARMQELINALEANGYTVARRSANRPGGNARLGNKASAPRNSP